MEIPLGHRIRRWRELAGLTQDQLAERVGVVQSAVANWESATNTPGFQNLLAVVAALDEELPRPGMDLPRFFGDLPKKAKRG